MPLEALRLRILSIHPWNAKDTAGSGSDLRASASTSTAWPGVASSTRIQTPSFPAIISPTTMWTSTFAPKEATVVRTFQSKTKGLCTMAKEWSAKCQMRIFRRTSHSSYVRHDFHNHSGTRFIRWNPSGSCKQPARLSEGKQKQVTSTSHGVDLSTNLFAFVILRLVPMTPPALELILDKATH